ncbi:MAG: KTSC domain-containing protein [Mesorhizobium sp.]|uniref:KTSC domain-containing protein n=1 Tax=Mesorhizobium sp. TaxID=1871066 RepID=UPI000FE92DBA|nr:KTSC domain-containing protein [Mesorhizobium sp.]RWP39948.1 MAG: KTSC domain-containing protein [Mesorhizobium sp.]TIM29132.1 MAG: KTSC domain-containing protein [Mesorhizobium sp.]
MPSTSIHKTEYDTGAQSPLGVVRGQRKCYQFEDVPPETFAEFQAAFAMGRFFNGHIRNHFRYRLVGPAVD